MSFKTNAYRFLVKLHVIGILVFGSFCVADLVTANNNDQINQTSVTTNTTQDTAAPPQNQIQEETNKIPESPVAETSEAKPAQVAKPLDEAKPVKNSAAQQETPQIPSDKTQAPALVQQITAPAAPTIQPITVNGDTVEYVADSREFVASGKVEVIYKGTKLNCDKLVVNADTKNATAEGHVRLEDKKGGIIEGDKIIYNFDKGTGSLVGAKFRSMPFFGMTEKMTKVSEDEFIAKRGYMTTCSLDHPHLHMHHGIT